MVISNSMLHNSKEENNLFSNVMDEHPKDWGLDPWPVRSEDPLRTANLCSGLAT